MKIKRLKRIPHFKNEDEERDFWAVEDATDYFDMNNEVQLDLSQLKPTTESISIRLPGTMLYRLKQIANARDIPYQSLMKMFIADRLDIELKNKSDY